MRVAIIAPRDPIPIYTGLLERLYQLSRFLGERHTVNVYFPHEHYRKQDETGRQPDHQPFTRVGLNHLLIEFVGKRIPTYTTLRGLYHLHLWLYRSLRRHLRQFDPDVVIVEMPFLIPVSLASSRDLDCQTVLSEHNVEYQFVERLDISLASALRRFETRVAGCVDTVVTVSEGDRDTLRRDIPNTEFVVAPNGVDVERYQPISQDNDAVRRIHERHDVQAPLFVYHGNLGNAQNREALTRLLNEVFPAVRDAISSASLLLVGADPPAVNQPGVVSTGLVDDLPLYLASADAALVPLQSGGGTKLKILEYLASGVPIVTTPIGAEGLPLEDEETALIRTNTKAFHQAAIRLVGDDALRERLKKTGRQMAAEHFSWDETLTPYNEIITRNQTE